MVTTCPPRRGGQKPAVPQGAGCKGRRPGLPQSWGKLTCACFLLPGGCFIPKLRPGCASRCNEKVRSSGESPDVGQPAPNNLEMGFLTATGLQVLPRVMQNHPIGHVMGSCSWLSLIASLFLFSTPLVLLEIAAAGEISRCSMTGPLCIGNVVEEHKPGGV